MLAQVGQLDVHDGLQPYARIGRAGEDVVQVRVPHEFLIRRLEESFSLGEAIVEASEHLLRVASLLHAEDRRWPSSLIHTRNILLSLYWLPWASGRSQAVSEASSRGQRLVEQKVVINELPLLRFCHVLERAVPDGQVAMEALLSFDVKPLGVLSVHSYSYSSGVSTLAM